MHTKGELCPEDLLPLRAYERGRSEYAAKELARLVDSDPSILDATHEATTVEVDWSLESVINEAVQDTELR